ncbi:hypothetical protein GOBAR_AA40034 [Gossypium barbadense]|uniref:Transmembrane protein 131-like N-terminal domain-containing protein n=1 Tax=Gossypium barbadense TaxID=3634 RepID=A0A2P5VPA3_GOSBA|nr:hypothetical protein GOBAR_AA40034 [Gossypium barbadense]
MIQPVKAFQFFLVLSCTLFCLITCEPCAVNGMPKRDEYEGCEYYGDAHHVGFQETIIDSTHSRSDMGTSTTRLSVERVCSDSHSFCFPSTLPGFLTEESTLEVGGLEVSRSQSDSASSFAEQSNLRVQASNRSWLSDHSMFKLLNGRTVSCSVYSRAGIHEFSSINTGGANQNDISCKGPLLSQKSTSVRMKNNKEVTKLNSFDGLSSPNVEINPPIMDWGHKYLFLPSVAYLTVANTCNDSILHIHEPFSTNIQFYPCNFSEVLLGPGEVASICFVFLPRWVGLSSAHLILQTSSGGFLVQARGFAVESPYEIQPLVNLDIPSSRQLSKNLSLFNPFDETLYVEEITSWISVSLGNSAHHTEAVCSVENFKGYNGQSLLGAEDWLVMNSDKYGFPIMAMRPSRKWEINPLSRETIVEIDLSPESEGKVFGAFCMQLQRSSQDSSDIIMVPLEVDLGTKASYIDHASSLSVSLDGLVPNDGSGTVFVAISLKNFAPYVLSIVKIDEVADAKVFHIKYVEGLLLYPGAVTQVAVIACTKLSSEVHDSSFEVSNMINSCKLLLMTNESISPQIEVSCEEIIHVCVEHQENLSMAYEHQKTNSLKIAPQRTVSDDFLLCWKMESKTLTIIKARKQLVFMFNSLRGMLQPVKAFQFFLVLSCTLFCLITCEPCAVSGMPKTDEYEGCEYYGDAHHVGFQETIIDSTHSQSDMGTFTTRLSVERVCSDSHSFCFPSTLPGFLTEESTLEVGGLEVSRSQSDSASSFAEQSNLRVQASNSSWLSDHSMFKLLNGRTVSCSVYSKAGIHEFSSINTDGANQNDISCKGPLLSQKSTSVRMEKNKEVTKLSSFDGLSSPNVEINPPIMDWGHKYLFLPSVAYLTVANTCNDSILHIHEPFSTNIQFYPCNFSEVLLGPGEVASICFVFLPRWVGLSSAHLVLQTSSGGFLVQARGFAVESPYEIQPLVNLDIPSSRQLSKNLSLFNPFDETLYVEEITSWISVSLGNSAHHTEAVCSVENFKGYNGQSLLGAEDWLVMNSDKYGFPIMAMRPSRKWEINPLSRETIVEIDLSPESEGKVFGAFCMQLQRSSQDSSDIIMVPLEVDLGTKASYIDHASSLSVSLDGLVPNDGSGTVFVAISLKNFAPYVLSIVKIDEVADAKVFHIKYVEGLLLYPGAVTQVAVIACTKLSSEVHDSSFEVSNMINSCKLLLMTNESISPQIEVSCEEIIHVCVEHQENLSMAYEHQSEIVKSGNTSTGTLRVGMQLASGAKVLQTAEVDELILANWKSQGASGGMSVLDDQEVLFPMVQVGSHCSKWITVKNPSMQPVVMQLILNSGEVIDECMSQDIFVKPPSGSLVHNSSTIPVRAGFSLGESAQTEAYVHPNGRASFGPILFHPSNRCGWTSSALIRNNLSGVEWLSLRGYGGSISLVLFEGSEPIQGVEFILNLPTSLNISPLQMLFHMEETSYACSQPFSKELYAKNTGDLPLEVQDCFYKSEKNPISTTRSGGKCSRDQRNGRFSMSAEVDGLLSSVEGAKSLKEASNGRFPNDHVRNKEERFTNRNAKLTPENDSEVNSFLDPQREISLPSLPSKSAGAVNPDTKEAPQTGNLTIRIGKDKGRRRRKRKGGFKELIEVSSSQSGNSTPSSPHSPTSVASNRTWPLSPDVEQSIESRNPFTHLANQICEKGKVPQPISKANVLGPKVSVEHVSNNWYSSQEQPRIPRQNVSQPVLSYSATFPCASRATASTRSSSSPLASMSVIAPCARAPGSKLSDQKIIKAERKGRMEDEYTYDIWGDHFSGLHLNGSSRDVVAVNSSTTENNSDSFFVRGPQTLMEKSQPRSVSYFNRDG